MRSILPNMDREAIEKWRKAVIDAFMAEDKDGYALAVVELERAIGKEPGDLFNHPGHEFTHEQRVLGGKNCGKIRRARTRLYKGSLDIDYADGVVAYSLKFDD